MRWEILGNNKNIKKTILKNRKIKDKKEFLNSSPPERIKNNDLGIKNEDLKRIINRIKSAKKNNEQVVIFGDYDADGVCSTAILWEALHEYGLNVLPYIPDRFTEGYGLKTSSFDLIKVKIKNCKLIIAVDNGIVAYDAINKAKELGIDVIVIDHHEKGEKELKAYSLLHTTSVCASGLAYFLARALKVGDGLELAAIGTIADQMPLTGLNRSIVKYGLEALNETKRPGLRSLFRDSGINPPAGGIGTYEVNYIIAPRINAMGRLGHALDSLRLLCTTKNDRAGELSKLLTKTNLDRQKIVETVVKHTKEIEITDRKVIVLAHESYHEGVIGLAAGKLVEEFYRPAIVLSKGKEVSKASARSISGFNIIESIRKLRHLYIEGGGHEMAAGFSIETKNIEKFDREINKIADELLTDEILERKLKIDCEVSFKNIDLKLVEWLKKLEPFGNGNYPPVFMSKNVEVLETKKVGTSGNHLKLKLKQNSVVLDAIWFNASCEVEKNSFDIAYAIEENVWNNHTSIQLKIKDIKVLFFLCTLSLPCLLI